MWKMFTVLAFAASVLASACAIAADGAEGASAFAEKSSKLTAGCSTRIDKAVAIFNFVRDEIAQVKTQYG